MKQHSRVLYLPTKSRTTDLESHDSSPMSKYRTFELGLDSRLGGSWSKKSVALDHLSIHLEEPNMFEKTPTFPLLKRY